MSGRAVYIADFLRLPIARQHRLYVKTPPEQFTAHLLRGLMSRNPFLVSKCDLLVLATSVGTGGNMARHISLLAGFPVKMPAFTIDSQCVGGYQSLISGYDAIKGGSADVVVVGGFESNSLRPSRFYHSADERYSPNPYFYSEFVPPTEESVTLPEAAEELTRRNGFTKEQLVDWVIISNERAESATQRGFLDSLIYPYNDHTADENFKTSALLNRFKSRAELIDAATSCRLDDGAGVLVLCSKKGAKNLAISPDFQLVSALSVGGLPQEAPAVFLDAVAEIFRRTGYSKSTIDLFEVNESFALKPLLFMKQYGVPPERLNMLGGNLAFGHPFGASGAINLIHLLKSMHIESKEFGLATAAAAGGLGSAVIVQHL